MDLRIRKTKRSIRAAFLELRKNRTLEKITVKELSELAEISKGTFYLHYKDIYDLSDQLQRALIADIIGTVPDPELFYSDPQNAHTMIREAFAENHAAVRTLFSGSQAAVLPILIEKEIRQRIFERYPAYETDIEMNTRLSFFILGSFYAYENNADRFSPHEVSQIIIDILKQGMNP